MPQTNRTAQRLGQQLDQAMRSNRFRHPEPDQSPLMAGQWPSPTNTAGPLWTTQGTSQATYSAAGDVLRVSQT